MFAGKNFVDINISKNKLYAVKRRGAIFIIILAQFYPLLGIDVHILVPITHGPAIVSSRFAMQEDILPLVDPHSRNQSLNATQ